MSHRVGSVYKKPPVEEPIDWAEIIGAPIALLGMFAFLYGLLLIGGTY